MRFVAIVGQPTPSQVQPFAHAVEGVEVLRGVVDVGVPFVALPLAVLLGERGW